LENSGLQVEDLPGGLRDARTAGVGLEGVHTMIATAPMQMMVGRGDGERFAAGGLPGGLNVLGEGAESLLGA